MVNKMRLPLLIAVVVIVALLLPGPLALAVTPDPPRMMGITSMISGSPGVKIVYGAKGDAKTGMVTFVGRGYNTQADIDWGKVGLGAKVPAGVYLVESWCSQPGTYPADYDPSTGWIRWSMVKPGFGSETNTHVCGFTVGGWDGKAILDGGWELTWAGAKVDKKPNALGWTDGTNNRNNVSTAQFRYPFDTEPLGGGMFARGFYRVVPQDGGNNGEGSIYVPSSATFRALEARVKALEAKAGMASLDEEE